MKPVERDTDFDEYYEDGRQEGLTKTKEGRLSMFDSFSDELDTRGLIERLKKFISKHGTTTMTEIYRGIKLERTKSSIQKTAFERLLSSGQIEKRVSPQAMKRGRRATTIVWIEKPAPAVKQKLTDEQIDEILKRNGVDASVKINDDIVPQADPLDQLIDSRKASQ